MKNRHMSKFLDIVDLYASDYSQALSGRAIARSLSISPQTALNALNELTKIHVLQFKVVGKNKLYTLELKQFETQQLLALSEQARSFHRLEHQELSLIIEGIQKHAECVIMFGSFAKSLEKKSSDIDLIAVGGDKQSIAQASKLFPREVNVETVSWKRLEASLKSNMPLAVEILKSHFIYGNVWRVVHTFVRYYARKL